MMATALNTRMILMQRRTATTKTTRRTMINMAQRTDRASTMATTMTMGTIKLSRAKKGTRKMATTMLLVNRGIKTSTTTTSTTTKELQLQASISNKVADMQASVGAADALTTRKKTLRHSATSQ